MSKPSEREWITPAEAARIRRVSRQAIGRLIARRRFTTTEFGGRTFVDRREIEEFEAKRPGRKPAS
jgi:hypothetical protein